MRCVMTEQEIRNYLGSTEVVGRKILCFEEIGSTNTYGKQLAQLGAANGTVVFADSQTAGRGRMERSFQSPKGKGIYLSVLFRPVLPAERLLPVTAMAGVAVCNAVERVCGIRPGLKWPNDLVLGNRKLSGILTEMGTDKDGDIWLVVGIGINVSQKPEDFSPDLQKIATSLVQKTGKPIPRALLTATLIEELDQMYIALQQQRLIGYLESYRRDCINLGKRVHLLQEFESSIEATAADVDEDFALIVQTDDGVYHTVRSGEVSVRGMYGYAE